MKKKTIAISLSTFPIYYLSFIIDFINNLSHNYDIDLFLHNVGDKIPNFNKNVRIYNFKNKINKSYITSKLFNFETIQCLKKNSKKNYFLIIGIESLGLIMANLIRAKNNTKLVYYNFEIYDKKNPGTWSTNFRSIKKEEKRILHQRNTLLVIQDKERLAAYKRTLNLNKKLNVFFLPVSLTHRKIIKKEGLQDIINIMYYGQISTSRFNTEIVQQSQYFDSKTKLILNAVSFNKERYIKELKTIDKKNNVIFDLNHLYYTKISNNIAKADIGLVFYRDLTINEKLTGKASVKMAHYMQANIPIICFKSTSISKIVNQYNIGVSISDISELNYAIKKITSKYDTYVKNTKKAYHNIYNLEVHMKKFQKIIIHG